jgi:hypothetical protein
MLYKPHSPSQLKGALTLALAISLFGSAQAQVTIVDKPYQPAAVQGALQLQIAPYAGSVQTMPVAPVQAPVAAPAPLKRWEILPEDQTLSRALARWAREERLQFFWEAPRDLLAVRASYAGTFEAAIRGVMVDSPTSGYPLHACQYDNSIRVLHTSQPCTH